MSFTFYKKIFFDLKIFFTLLLLISNDLFAQNALDPIIQQDWILRQQQNKIDEDIRLREQNNIKKERQRRRKELLEDQQIKPDNQIKKDAECYNIKKINLKGATIIENTSKKKILSAYENRCIDFKIIAEIIGNIENYYKERGYIAAKVSVPKQNIVDGIMDFDIYEGLINEVVINNNSFFDKMQEFTAFGMIDGNILNINEINQGIYQINRLQSNNATLKIEPSAEDGEAMVYINNKRKFPVHFSLNHDNLGNNFTGIYRTNFSSTIDNLLFLNDSINFTYTTNLNDENKIKDIKSFSSNISVPYKHFTLSYDYSRSEFFNETKLNFNNVKISGYSQRSAVTIDRVLLNKNNLRISSNLSLSTKSAATYYNNTKQESSERNLTVANFGFSLSNYFKNGDSLYIKPSYSKGLKILNAQKDPQDGVSTIPKSQFDYVKFYGSYSKKILIPQISLLFSLSTELDSQYAFQTLYGSEQFSVGGYYSVRGYRENYINGDSGYYIRNKAIFNIGSLLAVFARNNQGLIINNLNYLNKFSIEPFYDYGYVKNKYTDNGSDGRLSGGGIKTIFNSKYFAASLTYSQAVNNKSSLISGDKKEDKIILFEISANCC